MGAHIVFLVMHALAILVFGYVFLLLTIPLHLIFSAISARSGAAKPKPSTHVRCPDCREFVLKEAARCKHCGCGLIPQ